jgi:hypothetical protein
LAAAAAAAAISSELDRSIMAEAVPGDIFV